MNNYLENSKNKIEIYIGGALAIIAIVAIIAKTLLLGISVDTMLDMVINIAGLAVSALVMFVAIRSIITNSPKNLKQELEFAFQNWEADNRPLVFKVSDFEATEKYRIRYAILAKHTDFLGLNKDLTAADEAKYMTKNSKSSGKFVSLPSIDEMIQNDFIMEFHLINSTYSDDIKELISKTMSCLKSRFSRYDVKLSAKGSNDFEVEYKKISTKEEARELIAFINFVLTLLLIQS